MEEKFVLNELDQRQELWGWKWEAALSSSSYAPGLPASLPTLLLLGFSSQSPSLWTPFSLITASACSSTLYLLTHTFWATYYCCSFSFLSFLFFSQPHIVNKCNKWWSKWCRKVFSYNKEKRRMLHLPMSDRTLFRILKYQPGKTVNEVEIVDSINCANSGSLPTKI